MIERNEGSVKIRGDNPLVGEVRVPGDKSISHRALLLGALAEGETKIGNIAPGADVRSTMNCLRQLDVSVIEKNGRGLVKGRGLEGLEEPDRPLDAGNSGTLTRLIAGILATRSFETKIDGDDSLRSRPMERIIEPLELMGAEIDSREGRLALEITGGKLTGIEYQPDVASAQVKSCILLAGLGATGETTVEEVGPSRDHTERMLRAMGYPIEINGTRISVGGPAPLKPLSLEVPGDFSSASYLIAAGLLVEDSKIRLKSVGLNDTRTGFLDLLRKMGGSIEVSNLKTRNEEPRGDLVVSTSNLRGVTLTEDEVVRSIDELPLLAVVASQAEGVTEVRGAEELRVKETDRISATVENLKELGADIQELPDGFIIKGKTRLEGGNLYSFDDHRIAMSAAVAALAAEGETELRDPEWVEISFPHFFEVMEGLIDE
ncbi:MAG: 3-phosphoshikimate 1-carboxyvinyltransferase [Candidatus Bipolaricaulota bacterium]